MGTICGCIDLDKTRNELMLNSDMYNMTSTKNTHLNINKKKIEKKIIEQKNLSFYNFLGDKDTDESFSNDVKKSKFVDSQIF